MTTFAEALQRCMWGKVGSQKLSNLTNISKSKIDSWLQGRVQHPRDWRPILTIAQVLLLTHDEADALLLAAGHPTIRELAERLASEHPDRTYLQRWVEAAPLPPSSRHQLRASVADFVGREAEIARLEAALLRPASNGGKAAITGVQGMGGIGKTELAYVVADKLRGAFPDAQIVLTLRGSSPTPLPPEQTLQTVIRAFTPNAKLPEDVPTLEGLYRAQLDAKRALILADDATDAAQVRPLLPPPGCALLVTSRTRFILPGMTTVDLEQLSEAEAVTLLRNICRRIGEADAQALARACGYLPLALRVSGSILHNTPALPVVAYLQRLADERQHLALLRDPDDAQLDVAASLFLSYAQLDKAAQQVFRQLGVIVADFDTALALAVVDVAETDVEAVLHLLLRRNLVIYDVARARWNLHDLVRDVALRCLEEADEREAACWRYARYAMRIAHETQDQYRVDRGSVLAALVRFDVESSHMDTARRWAIDHTGILEGDRLLLEDVAATNDIGRLRYDLQRERIPQGERVLAAARRLGDRQAERMALNYLGSAYRELGHPRRTIPYCEQALSISRALEDPRGEGMALNNLGTAYAALGEARRAIPFYEQAVAIARALGEGRAEGLTMHNLANAYTNLGQARQAMPYYEQSLTIARKTGDRRGEAYVLHSLGNTYTDLGDLQRAIQLCTVAHTITREIGDKRLESYALSYLAHAQTRQGDLTHATATFAQALALFREVGDRWGEAECQWLFGLALVQQGDWGHARDLLRAAVAYEQEIGHAMAAEHAAQIARLEAGDMLPVELLEPASQRAVGENRTAPMHNDAPR